MQLLALDDFVAKDSMARKIDAFSAPNSFSLLSLEQNFKRG